MDLSKGIVGVFRSVVLQHALPIVAVADDRPFLRVGDKPALRHAGNRLAVIDVKCSAGGDGRRHGGRAERLRLLVPAQGGINRHAVRDGKRRLKRRRNAAREVGGDRNGVAVRAVRGTGDVALPHDGLRGVCRRCGKARRAAFGYRHRRVVKRPRAVNGG